MSLGVYEVTLGAAKTPCVSWAFPEAEPETRTVCRWFPWETIPGDRGQGPGEDQRRRRSQSKGVAKVLLAGSRDIRCGWGVAVGSTCR